MHTSLDSQIEKAENEISELEKKQKLKDLEQKKKSLRESEKGILSRQLGPWSTIAVIGSLCMLCFCGYFFFIYVPKYNADLDNQHSECASNAYINYLQRWGDSCENLDRERDCSLPIETAQSYERDYDNDLIRCDNLYK